MLVDYGGPSAATILEEGDELFLLGHDVDDREPMGRCLPLSTLEPELRVLRLQIMDIIWKDLGIPVCFSP
jgi:hypothetical protein